MSKNIEIEAKTLITKEEYETLIDSLGDFDFEIINQYNHYFCEEEYLNNPKKSSLAIRIRKENEKIEATLKINLKEGKLEINQDLSEEEYRKYLSSKKFPKGEVIDYLYENHICKSSELKEFATLKNLRYEFKYKEALIAIDRSEYLNKIDYEVECEASSMEIAESLLKELLNIKKIPYRENRISKLKRVKNAI